jgi:Spy/CpxP family protein refolding chaperone
VAVLVAVGLTSVVELVAADWQAQARNQTPVQTERKDEKSSGRPGTPWWKDESARAEIGFTAEQAAEIDRIFKAYIDKAKPLREEVNALEGALSATMKANMADVSVVEKQVDKVENKRAELNKLRVVMLYRMHRVLTPEQNARLQAYRDRREAERRKLDGDRRR